MYDSTDALEGRREVGCGNVGNFDNLKFGIFLQGFLEEWDFTSSGGSGDGVLVVHLWLKSRGPHTPFDGVTCLEELVYYLKTEESGGASDLTAE